MASSSVSSRSGSTTAHAKSRSGRKDAGSGRPVTPAAPTRAKTPKAGAPARTVGVRELRQNLSVYLARVKQGEALEVTEHGHVVAVLRPVPPSATRHDILLAKGLITPATRSIRDLPPPRQPPPGSRPMSEILDELREDRF